MSSPFSKRSSPSFSPQSERSARHHAAMSLVNRSNAVAGSTSTSTVTWASVMLFPLVRVVGESVELFGPEPLDLVEPGTQCQERLSPQLVDAHSRVLVERPDLHQPGSPQHP